jgi:hypothetical protein
MNGKRAFVAIAVAAALGLLSTSTARSSFDHGRNKGGFVKPCSLDGVNPVYHPDIFGNPALARAYYGFVQSRDGAWHVMPNCRIY